MSPQNDDGAGVITPDAVENPQSSPPDRDSETPALAHAVDAAQRRALAKLERKWAAAAPDHPRLIAYFEHRGLAVRDVPAALRLAERETYYGENREDLGDFPAILARVETLDGELVALHRTYLNPVGDGKLEAIDGQKIKPKKLTRALRDGATRGAAIHLDEPLDGTLALAEGVETALAVRQATGAAIWACVSAGGLAAVEIPPSVERVDIYGDRDRSGAGQEAAATAARRLRAEGRRVRVLLPPLEGEDWLDVQRERGDSALVEAAAKSSDYPAPIERAQVLLAPDEHRVVDESVAALSRDPQIYSRGGVLATVLPSGGIRELRLPSIREALTRQVAYHRRTDEGSRWVHPPEWCVSQVAERGHYPELRELLGVVSQPTTRPDGSILSEPGYDPATGLVLAPHGQVDLPAAHPTREDALRARDALLDVVADFHFSGDEHRSAWLALVLTLTGRSMYAGDTPLFLIDANTRGAGKGLLADCAAMIATGRTLSRSPLPGDDDEMRKTISSIAIAGMPAILFDNATGTLRFRSLDAALTCGGSWSDRVLGRSVKRTWPLRATWVITGNNLTLGSDLVRRTLHIRLVAEEEHPEDRQDFRRGDLLGWISQERSRLAGAALTILGAWHAAGRPAADLPAWGSFTGWSAIIRQTLVWLDLPDPAAGRAELRERADIDRDAIAALYRAMADLGPMTARELVERAATHPGLAEALAELVPPGRGEDLPAARRVGYALRALRGRVVIGFRLEATQGHTATLRWRVAATDRQAARNITSITSITSRPGGARAPDGGDGGHGGDCSSRLAIEIPLGGGR